ncbi:MAG TPA: alpha/beta fold hydrolase [Dehalococcoidia bacterium]|jgi:pimeloyl-ACP methyl ester carboxylesterase
MAERVRPSIWQEARVGGELARLVGDPVYGGDGLPRGDGRYVLILPGLFANDLYLQPMHRWLRKMRYRPLRSTLLVNAGCPQRLCEEIEGHLRVQTETRPGPIALIGHSRGGILAWAIAARLQERASHLVLLGSPAPAVVRAMDAQRVLAGKPAGAAVQRAGNRARQMLDPDCDVPECACPFPVDMRRPLHARTRVVSIYSSEDPIVPKAACRVRGGRNVEVQGTHSGLAYNIDAYRVIAETLASGL